MRIAVSGISIILVGLMLNFPLWGQSDYKLEIIGSPNWEKVDGVSIADTFWLEFNIFRRLEGKMDEYQRYKPALSPDEVEFTVRELFRNDQLRPPGYVPGSLTMLSMPETGFVFPDSITVSLLIDRSGSLTVGEMEQIREAVRAFVESVPGGNVFISSFHNDILSTVLATKDNFNSIDLTRTNMHTDLYNAIYAKLLEFDEFAFWPNIHFEKGYQINPEIAKRKSKYNYLVVLTDGVNDTERIPKYNEPGFQVITRDMLFDAIDKYKNKVKIFTLGFGGIFHDLDTLLLKEISFRSGLSDGYFFAEPESILNRFQVNLVESMAIDYRARFYNQPKKVYRGHQHELIIELKDKQTGLTAEGKTTFQIGTIHNPVTTGEKEKIFTLLFWGILTAIIIILVVLIIIQLVWPLIKNKIFNLKYIRKFKAHTKDLATTCPLCFDPINDNDKVVIKCQHMVHHECWKANDYCCPEFPQNCSIGKQNYFDLNDPFSRRNKLYYLNWVLFGMVGGLFTWICYIFLKDLMLFDKLSGNLVEWISKDAIDFKDNYIQKNSPLLLIGMLMGFFLSLSLAYVEEFRRLSFLVLMWILIRGLIGAVIGFITFFIGNVLTIIAGQHFTVYWFDWIPWMLFGASIGLALSVKTTIHWKHGLLGGILSIIFAFLLLYILSGELVYLAVLICFMIYGAGLGVAIATVRSTAEHYFIKILNGAKEGSMIAVHKWMSSQGGLNEVYIGKSNICEIQVNWEKGIDIGDKHAKIYINKSRNIPVIVSLEKGKSTLYDERFEMALGKEYDLLNGVTFKIGETLFQYIEKDS